MRTSTRWLAIAGTAALALATGLAGIAIGVGATAPSAPGGQPTSAATPAQPADLGDADLVGLAQALAPDGAADAGQAAGLGALRRLTALRGRNLVHAEVTVDRNGTLVTFDLDRGTISAIGSGSLTVKQAGGGSRTVATNDATRVRRDRGKAKLTDLSTGDAVVILSKVDGSKPTATFVLVPAQPRAAPAGTPAPAPVAP